MKQQVKFDVMKCEYPRGYVQVTATRGKYAEPYLVKRDSATAKRLARVVSPREAALLKAVQS